MILKDFSEILAPRLREDNFLRVYLVACLGEGLPTFYVGLREAVQARDGGFSWLARETGMARAGLYQALSANGNPSLKTIYNVLVALGVDTSILAGKTPEVAPHTQQRASEEVAAA